MSLPDEVTVEFLGNRVGGIARPESSPAVFIRGALPGERVRVKKLTEKKSFIEAELLSILEPSPFRTKPFCKHYGRCGGCSLQHLEYTRELYWKRLWIEKALRRLDTPEVESVLPSPDQKACRNRITFDINQNRLCLHAFRGDPIPVDSCPLVNPRTSELLRALKGVSLPRGLKRVSVRGAVNTGEGAIEFSGTPADVETDTKTSVFERSGNKWLPLKGNGMTEKLGGLLFPVPPGGFFQVNTKAADVLIRKVSDMIQGSSGSILDLYGGVGTFGLPLAARGFQVESVEMNREASKGCQEAITMNNLQNSGLNAVCTIDRSYLSSALKQGRSFDVLITDPPRAGMGIRITRQIRRLSPQVIVYVSCNPFSAARDIAILMEDGYKMIKIAPVDMFPGTDHVETVFLLEGGDQ